MMAGDKLSQCPPVRHSLHNPTCIHIDETTDRCCTTLVILEALAQGLNHLNSKCAIHMEAKTVCALRASVSFPARRCLMSYWMRTSWRTPVNTSRSIWTYTGAPHTFLEPLLSTPYWTKVLSPRPQLTPANRQVEYSIERISL